ncbi:MAG: hypothetical protein O2955_04410 [Planctomycetota bacterium]|nr:hypothetical protein [Planctomycetota bacterium]MDA1211732.1 hypothetical protein [Planctomycetota bacterium]
MLRRFNSLPALVLAFVLTVGISSAWTLIVGFVGESINLSGRRIYESVSITHAGLPVIVRYDAKTQKSSYRTPEGIEIDSEQPEQQGVDFDFNGGGYASFGRDMTGLNETTAQGTRIAAPASITEVAYPHVIPFNDGRTPSTFWYYLQDRRVRNTGYFVGYDSQSREVIGYYTRRGFQSSPPQNRNEWFDVAQDVSGLANSIASNNPYNYYGSSVREPFTPVSTTARDFYEWNVFLVEEGRVWKVNLRERESPPQELDIASGVLSLGISLGVMFEANDGPNDKKVYRRQHDALIISTADDVLVYDPIDESIVRLPRPDELKGKQIAISRTIEGKYIFHQLIYDREADTTHVLFTISPEGDVLKRQQFTTTMRGANQNLLLVALLMPHPLGATVMTLLAIPMSSYSIADETVEYAALVKRSLAENWPALFVAYLLAVICAWRTVVRQRRYGDPVVIPWVIFVFLTGVPGYLGYLAHRRWPVRLACPSCAAKTPRDRHTCLDCGLEFPPPELKGIEVFA